tara:strand:+ start:84 stop:650 length:567 start_codon:yes stop_codon:yes gene_type:complete
MFVGIYDIDCEIMTNILDNIKFYSGTERKKMLKKNKIKHPSDGGSMLYGTTWRGYLSPTKTRTKDIETGLYKTKIMDQHPELKHIFRTFADFHFKDFEWTQVQMNKNFACGPHFDSTNIGESVLCTFGDFTGGNTAIEVQVIPEKILSESCKDKPICFNGSKYKHWVEPWDGTRYSLVFFNNKSSKKK